MGRGGVRAKPLRQRCIGPELCYRDPMSWCSRLSAAACALLAAGCDGREAAVPVPEETEAAQALPALPVAEAALDRQDLLLAVLRAGSAAAAGESDSDVQRELAGKPFAMRMRFGCPSEPPEETRRVSFAEEEGIVRIELAPEVDRATPLMAELVGTGAEAVEGFWIRRPWLLHAACPPAAARAPSAATDAPPPGADTAVGPADAENEQRIAIAQFFTAEDARTHRRDSRAYQATERLAEGEAPSAAGYDLVLEGRLQRLPNGQVIVCRAASSGPPACIVSARFDQVSVERADNGELLAEWPGG